MSASIYVLTLASFDVASTDVEYAFLPIVPKKNCLKGGIQNNIQNSIEHWILDSLPYNSSMNLYRTGCLNSPWVKM